MREPAALERRPVRTRPGLATKYENPTPTTWVYTIRQGVTFHDGTTLTADDVVASLKYHLNPDVGSYWNSVYRNVKSIEKTGYGPGHRDAHAARCAVEPVHGGEPGHDRVGGHARRRPAPTTATRAPGVNCTGPFSFDSWTPGQSITLKRYDGYWDTA